MVFLLFLLVLLLLLFSWLLLYSFLLCQMFYRHYSVFFKIISMSHNNSVVKYEELMFSVTPFTAHNLQILKGHFFVGTAFLFLLGLQIRGNKHLTQGHLNMMSIELRDRHKKQFGEMASISQLLVAP